MVRHDTNFWFFELALAGLITAYYVFMTHRTQTRNVENKQCGSYQTDSLLLSISLLACHFDAWDVFLAFS